MVCLCVNMIQLVETVCVCVGLCVHLCVFEKHMCDGERRVMKVEKE